MANTHSLDLESGSSQYASVADTAPLSITGDMTLMCWVNPESDTTIAQTLISKWDPTNSRKSYALTIGTSGAFDLTLSSDGSAATTKSSNYAFILGGLAAWIHLAVTYNAAAGTCKFYINGVLDSTGSGLPTSIHNNISSFAIGAQDVDGTADSFVDGKIDEVKVFNAELTAAQVLAEMHLDGTANSPVGYWKLNNGYTDESGNGATLTPSGSPVFSTTVPFSASGTSVEITSTKSTYLTSAEPDTNKETEDLYVGEHNAGVETMRSLVQFDLSSIPAGSTINSAFLDLTFVGDASDNARVFSVYRVKRAWVEDQATWNVYSTGNSWTTAGAADTTNDREGTAINTYHAQVAAPDTTNGRKGVILDAAKIQEMITGGVFTNNGFLLQVANESNDAIIYGGDNNATATKRPILLVDYTAPESGGLIFIST